jgi:DNA-binding beta-propeller fold protein YncE
VHEPTERVFVAHTANDAVDVIDIAARKYVGSIPGLPAVAGALVAAESDLVFTSNRGENTVGIFRWDDVGAVDKIGVGVRPNGLACDPRGTRLLVAHVGDPAVLARSRCRSSTFPGGNGSWTFPSQAGRAGPSTIRLPACSTSTSPIPRRWSWWARAIRSASAAWCRSSTPAPTASTSTSPATALLRL